MKNDNKKFQCSCERAKKEYEQARIRFVNLTVHDIVRTSDGGSGGILQSGEGWPTDKNWN